MTETHSWNIAVKYLYRQGKFTIHNNARFQLQKYGGKSTDYTVGLVIHCSIRKSIQNYSAVYLSVNIYYCSSTSLTLHECRETMSLHRTPFEIRKHFQLMENCCFTKFSTLDCHCDYICFESS